MASHSSPPLRTKKTSSYLQLERFQHKTPEKKMGTRTGSHQLSSGLMVSGRPDHQPKERHPTIASRAVIYTGGDVKKSGELGIMCGIAVSSEDGTPKSPHRPTGVSVRSGPLGPKPTNSGPMGKKLSSSSSFSGSVTPIHPTGLITSGPPPGSKSNRRSGQLPAASSSFKRASYGAAVTSLGEEVGLGFRVSRVAMWMFLVVAVMGLVVGAFVMAAVEKSVILVAAVAVLGAAGVFLAWNCVYREHGVLGLLRKYGDVDLRGAVDGQYVKVTGVVTCGSIPLETSFQKVPRCVYVSSELYEYRGFGGKPANAKQRFFSWGRTYSEKYVADFYISDKKSGLRALVKTGNGAKVVTFVKPNVVADVTNDNKEIFPNFSRWLSDQGLPNDERLMRLKEGYIKEGGTAIVMGVIRHQHDVVTIVPPAEPISTGCRWPYCLLPTLIDSLILMSDERRNSDVIPV